MGERSRQVMSMFTLPSLIAQRNRHCAPFPRTFLWFESEKEHGEIFFFAVLTMLF